MALAVLLAAVLACSVVAPRPSTATPFPTLPLTALPNTPAPTPPFAPTLAPSATGTDWSPASTPTPRTGLPATGTPGALPGRDVLAGQIVYTCFVDGFDNLCLMDADGTVARRLTTTEATDFYPSLSPDGTQIVFSSRRNNNFDLYVLDIATANVRQLTSGLGSNFGPEFSPDGERVAFASSRDNVGHIWVIDANGANPRQLTTTGSNIDPTWSPDGTEILFASLRAGSTELYVIRADGTGERRLTEDLNVGGRSDWSPGGDLVTFYAGEPSGRDIFTYDLDTQVLRHLTNSGDNRGPCFSPDGEWIVFAGFRDGDNEIYATRVDGSVTLQLTDNARPDWQPRWGRKP